MILKFHLIYKLYVLQQTSGFLNLSWINLQRSIPEKQIFFLVFDKSIKFLLNLV